MCLFSWVVDADYVGGGGLLGVLLDMYGVISVEAPWGGSKHMNVHFPPLSPGPERSLSFISFRWWP